MKATLAVAFAAVFVTFAYGTEAIQCPPENEDDVTLLPNPNDCASYYSCNHGIPWPMRCPDGLNFNAELRVCDSPEHAKCASSNSSTPNSTLDPETHRPKPPGTRPPPTGNRPIPPGTRPPPPGNRPTPPGSRPPPPGNRPTPPGSRPPPPGSEPSPPGIRPPPPQSISVPILIPVYISQSGLRS